MRTMRVADLELCACTPCPLDPSCFNPKAEIPYGCTTKHISKAMTSFLDFLGFVNTQLHSKRIQRLESFLMPANFSSMVGEFMAATIPKSCSSLVKNLYHNGHPDLIPTRMYPGNSCLHGSEGIEVKAS